MKVDKDGYLTVTLGIFDKNISSEVFTDLKKRCQEGKVYSELGYPKQKPLEPAMDFFTRLNTADPDKSCAQIMDVEMSPDNTRMIGKVRLHGPQGDVVRKMLEGEEAVFGMRSFYDTADREQVRPVHIATYDLVAKP